ncbi:MAG: hypothetical protein OEY34_08405 [Cyclobacteriaceae bacterium]|nr:hypothetical protein [Cyclobacteriaceae bacterium]
MLLVNTFCTNRLEKPCCDDVSLYFPISTNDFFLYEKYHKQYNTDGSIIYDTTDLKVITGIPYSDNVGETVFPLYYYSKPKNSVEWIELKTIAVKVQNGVLIINDNAKQLVKLSVPIVNNHTWDVNVFNTDEADEFKIINLGDSFQSFTGTLTVLQEDNQDYFLQLDQRKEVFAQYIGMVYSEKKLINYCTENNCFGQQVIDSGYEEIMVLIEKGKE